MIRITRSNILVRIDKKAQLEKRSQTKSGIIIPDAFQYMERNLQYGEILQIGAIAHERFPEMEVGDTCIFHHTIEDGDHHLLDTEDNGDELRWVSGENNQKIRNFQIYGVYKPDGGYIIPSPWFLFLSPVIRPAKRRIDSRLVVVDQDMWEDEERIQLLIKDLEMQEKSLQENFAHLKDVDRELMDVELIKLEPSIKAINSIREQRKNLTKKLASLNMWSAEILHIYEQTAYDLGVMPGDRVLMDKRSLYPLDFADNRYLCLARDHVWGVAKIENAAPSRAAFSLG